MVHHVRRCWTSFWIDFFAFMCLSPSLLYIIFNISPLSCALLAQSLLLHPLHQSFHKQKNPSLTWIEVQRASLSVSDLTSCFSLNPKISAGDVWYLSVSAIYLPFIFIVFFMWQEKFGMGDIFCSSIVFCSCFCPALAKYQWVNNLKNKLPVHACLSKCKKVAIKYNTECTIVNTCIQIHQDVNMHTRACAHREA